MSLSAGTQMDLNRIMDDLGERFHNKVFVQSIEDGRTITFGQFTEQCNRFGRFLESRGLKAGDRVVLISPNCVEWLIVFFGTLKYGATIAPVYEGYSEKSIIQLLSRMRPKFIFWHGELSEGLPVPGDDFGKWIPFGPWDASDATPGTLFFLTGGFPGQPPEESEEKTPDCSALIHTTSGTMDEPRCVLRSYQCFAYHARTSIRRWNVTEKDIFLEYRSFAWISASAMTLSSALYTGATVVIAKKFSSSQFFKWLKEYQITIAVGVPAVINMLLEKNVTVNQEDFPALRFITSSSAPLYLSKQREFESSYGIPIIQFMGMTEAGLIACSGPEDRKIGSPGRPADHAHVSIVDDKGKLMKPGEEGEIVCGGKHVGQYYLLETGELEVFAPGGSMRTGDIGYLDEEGFLFVTGRKKNVIIRGGVNISPLQVDRVLLEHPRIDEAATIGIPDAIYGEEIVSLVVLKAGTRTENQELLAHCKTKLSREMAPKNILIVEEIPKSDRGKVVKQQLLDLYFSRCGSIT